MNRAEKLIEADKMNTLLCTFLELVIKVKSLKLHIRQSSNLKISVFAHSCINSNLMFINPKKVTVSTVNLSVKIMM
jgi:hypothetical protein